MYPFWPRALYEVQTGFVPHSYAFLYFLSDGIKGMYHHAGLSLPIFKYLGGDGASLWSQRLGGRQRQVDLYELEASLVYKASSRTARVTQRNHVSKKKQKYIIYSIFIKSKL